MRLSSWITVPAALVLAGCASGGGGSSPSTGGSVPSGGPAAPEASVGPPDACTSGNCKVAVKIPDNVASDLMAKQPIYKLYEGCPKRLGVTGDDTTDVSGLRAATPFLTSGTPIIAIPGTMKGHLATVSMWFGSVPERFVVVNFLSSSTQTVDFGYMEQTGTSGSHGSFGGMSMGGGGGGTGLGPDQTVLNQNKQMLHKLCQ